MINSIGIHIKVSNFAKSVEFYEALGFNKIFEYGPDKDVKESYNGMVFEHGGSKLEIADGHVAVKPSVFKEFVKTSKMSLMIKTDNLPEIVKRCNDNNIKIAVNPRHYYWGTLELVIKDPDGVVLVFITDYDEVIAKNINADEKWARKQ